MQAHLESDQDDLVLCCSTFDPGLTGSFTISLECPQDPSARLELLPPLGAGKHASNPVGSLVDLSSEPSIDPTAFEPVYHRAGKGVSKDQSSEVIRRVETIVSQLPPGVLFNDMEFDANLSSIGQADWDATAKVRSWRRPSEIAGASATLFDTGGGSRGIVLGESSTAWIMGTLNLIAADDAEMAKLFIETSYADRGIYVVKILTEEAGSQIPWRVVVIDDRIPCGSDGLPCFARSADTSAFWVCLVEKALAKIHGSYGKLTSPLSVSATLRALGMLSGGSKKEVLLPIAGGNADAAWASLQASWDTPHLRGVMLSSSLGTASAAAAAGIVPDRPYSLLTNCDVEGVGRMVKLRGFYGEPEWNGKWSDRDTSWTNQLRNFLNYKDAADGTFFMSFEDMCKYFSHLLLVEEASEHSSFARVDAEWADASGPTTTSWRANHQWLLHVTKPTRINVEISQLGTIDSAGFLIMRANDAPYGRRRKLWVDESDIIHHLQPVQGSISSLEFDITPMANGKPYVIIPYRDQPEASTFTMKVYCKEDDFGELPFKIEFIRPEFDWFTSRVQVPWSQVATVGSGDIRGGLQIFMRSEFEGDVQMILYADSSFDSPDFLLALVKDIGTRSAALKRLPPNPMVVAKSRPDGLSCVNQLPNNEGHIAMPLLQEAPEQIPQGVCTITIYSERRIDVSLLSGEWVCDLCRPGHCPYMMLLQKMDTIEMCIEARCADMDSILGN